MKIPVYFDEDCYLQVPIIKRFIRDHKLKPESQTKPDYIKVIESYANNSENALKEVLDWLDVVVKEGTKELCYKKIVETEPWLSHEKQIRSRLLSRYPECKQQSLVNYKSTKERQLVSYEIKSDPDGRAVLVQLVFSQLFLKGESGQIGKVTCCPVFVDVYLKEGFLVSRCKAKSTLFLYDDQNQFLISDNRVDTMELAGEVIDGVCELFEISVETDVKKIKNQIYQTQFRIYNKFTFTPKDVLEKIKTERQHIASFVDLVFGDLGLDVKNKEAAITDLEIFVEKYVSINGDNEDLFRKDRQAYLVLVSSDNEEESTRIDTQSSRLRPLQCTEAFFDSKKSIISSGLGKKLSLIFKRDNDDIFPKREPLEVQYGVHKGIGYVKTTQYAEEGDIENVLRTIFENY